MSRDDVTIEDIDLNDLDVWERTVPHAWFDHLRAHDPVHFHDGGGEEDYWCITKHADLVHVSTHPHLFSSEAQTAIVRDQPPAVLPGMRQMMLNMDPPRHARFRALINKAFTPRMVEALRPRIEARVEGIIDSVVERGECEFVGEVAAPLPMEVICDLVGVPEEDRRGVFECANRMIGYDDPELHDGELPPIPEDFELACGEMFMFAEKLKAARRAEPRDDLASRLLAAEVDGKKLDDLEFNSFFLLLAIAGNETTQTVTTNGMRTLIEHPDQYAALRETPSLIPGAIDEILRYEPAVLSFRRTAMEETEVRGVRLPANAKVIMWYPSANRDEEVFADPHTFDVRRSENPHVAFGIGEHFCLGANLARLELEVLFEALVRRIPDMELDGAPRRLRSNFTNGVKEMRVRFTPGGRVAAAG